MGNPQQKHRRIFYGWPNKRKGKKTVSRRAFLEDELTSNSSKKLLVDLFETFMRAKELEGLRPRTLNDHRATFGYFLSFLKLKYPTIQYVDEITTDVIRDYIYYMSKEKQLWMTIPRHRLDIERTKGVFLLLL